MHKSTKKQHVFIVLEFHVQNDTRVVGVYSDREAAKVKMFRSDFGSRLHGISYGIVKKTVHGQVL